MAEAECMGFTNLRLETARIRYPAARTLGRPVCRENPQGCDHHTAAVPHSGGGNLARSTYVQVVHVVRVLGVGKRCCPRDTHGRDLAAACLQVTGCRRRTDFRGNYTAGAAIEGCKILVEAGVQRRSAFNAPRRHAPSLGWQAALPLQPGCLLCPAPCLKIATARRL